MLSDGDGLQKIDPSLGPVSYALGVLGMPGLTAYAGLLNIGQPKAGETLVVAAASGAVGSVVGQIAKLKGCRVIGIAGGAEKCRYVREELGFDDCLDHREPYLADRLRGLPRRHRRLLRKRRRRRLHRRLPLLNNFARIPVCGLIAHYNATCAPAGPDRLPQLMKQILVSCLTFRGYIVSDFASQYPLFLTEVVGWLRDGRIKYKEDVTEGLENAPRELIGLRKWRILGRRLCGWPRDEVSNSKRGLIITPYKILWRLRVLCVHVCV